MDTLNNFNQNEMITINTVNEDNKDTEAGDKMSSKFSSKKTVPQENPINEINKEASPLLHEGETISRSGSPNLLSQVKTMMQVKSVLKSKLTKNKDPSVPTK